MTGQVFAIGLGTADQLNPAALDDLVSGTGGFLLLTGNPGLDDQILLKKYFAQILAGVTNGVIVVDPDGFVPLDGEAIVPYDLTSADSRSDVIVLGDAANLLTVLLEAPDGSTLDGSSGADLVLTEQYQTLRVALPSCGRRLQRRYLACTPEGKQATHAPTPRGAEEAQAKGDGGSSGIPRHSIRVDRSGTKRPQTPSLCRSVVASPRSDRDAHGDAHRVGDPAREERKRYRCDLGPRREPWRCPSPRSKTACTAGRYTRLRLVFTARAASGGHQPARRAIHT